MHILHTSITVIRTPTSSAYSYASRQLQRRYTRTAILRLWISEHYGLCGIRRIVCHSPFYLVLMISSFFLRPFMLYYSVCVCYMYDHCVIAHETCRLRQTLCLHTNSSDPPSFVCFLFLSLPFDCLCCGVSLISHLSQQWRMGLFRQSST